MYPSLLPRSFPGSYLLLLQSPASNGNSICVMHGLVSCPAFFFFLWPTHAFSFHVHASSIRSSSHPSRCIHTRFGDACRDGWFGFMHTHTPQPVLGLTRRAHMHLTRRSGTPRCLVHVTSHLPVRSMSYGFLDRIIITDIWRPCSQKVKCETVMLILDSTPSGDPKEAFLDICIILNVQLWQLIYIIMYLYNILKL